LKTNRSSGLIDYRLHGAVGTAVWVIAFHSYIYSLTSLVIPPEHVQRAAPQNLNENLNLQLSLNAASTYLLTLTIPGAKSYGVFDEDVIEQVLKIFRLLELNGNKSVRANTVWMFFLTICDDLKVVFRYVHFKEHLKPRDRIIRCLMEVLYMNFKVGYQNSCEYSLIKIYIFINLLRF